MMSVIDDEVDSHRRRRVVTYRAYRIDDAGRATEAASVFEAPDDDTAIIRARALMGNCGRLEIWQKSRQVALIQLEPGNAGQ
jgi:hypothetical protein